MSSLPSLPARFLGRRWLLAAALSLAALSLAACSAAPRGESEAAWREYLEVARQLRSEGAPLARGSAGEQRAVERFRSLLANYTAPDFPQRAREIYADELFFNDTLKTLRTSDEVAAYFADTAEALAEGTVEFVDLAVEDGDYYFRWLMTMRFERLANGRETVSMGMTHVRFDGDGRVVLHQDFWDSAGGLFEHVPVLGWALRRAKRRI